MAGQPAGERKRRIVVGVDGSVPSTAALAWAVGQARLTGAVVEAVTAWDYPVVDGYRVPVIPDVSAEELAQRAVAGAVAEVSRSADDVEIRPRLVEGDAARVLLDASAGPSCW